MLTTLSQITPILVGFVVGHLLRRGGIASAHDASFIFKIVFYVCVPALSFASLAIVDITRHLLIFSLLAALLYLIGCAAARLMVPGMNLSSTRRPVLFIACMGVNSVFALPFLQNLYGAEGVARFVAYDTINVIVLYSWTYSIAVRANPAHVGSWIVTRRLMKSPPLYGVAGGLIVNLLELDVPDSIANTASTFSAPTGFLVTLAIGIALRPKREDVHVAVRVIAIRLATALLVGLTLIGVFDLSGIDRTAVLLLCVSPIAFSTATFAALENLDVEFAARTLSISLALGVVMATVVAVVFA